MIRPAGTPALFLLLLAAAPARAQHVPLPDPHVRSGHAEIVEALADGAHASPTVRALLDRLERSDVVVYVMWHRTQPSGVAAHVSFLSAAGGRRYLAIGVDPKYAGCQLVSLLAHELRHAVEIADDPSVVDVKSLIALYQRIGYDVGGRTAEQFDSRSAIETGRDVMREMLARRSAGTHVQ